MSKAETHPKPHPQRGKLDVAGILDTQGETLTLHRTLDLSDITLAGGYTPFQTPVDVTGKVENRAGVTTFAYTARLSMDLQCDRCLTPFHRDEALRLTHVLVRWLSGEEDDAFMVLPDGVLDVDETVHADIVLWLPFRQLCREDCSGLCPCCGTNLNENACTCVRP